MSIQSNNTHLQLAFCVLCFYSISPNNSFVLHFTKYRSVTDWTEKQLVFLTGGLRRCSSWKRLHFPRVTRALASYALLRAAD